MSRLGFLALSLITTPPTTHSRLDELDVSFTPFYFPPLSSIHCTLPQDLFLHLQTPLVATNYDPTTRPLIPPGYQLISGHVLFQRLLEPWYIRLLWEKL
jgi:hypothetical protein